MILAKSDVETPRPLSVSMSRINTRLVDKHGIILKLKKKKKCDLSVECLMLDGFLRVSKGKWEES